MRALLKVSACRPRLVVAQSMNGRSGHGTTHVDEVEEPRARGTVLVREPHASIVYSIT